MHIDYSIDPWDRQEGETAEHHVLFCKYASILLSQSMTGDDSDPYAELEIDTTIGPDEAKELADANDWDTRAAAYVASSNATLKPGEDLLCYVESDDPLINRDRAMRRLVQLGVLSAKEVKRICEKSDGTTGMAAGFDKMLLAAVKASEIVLANCATDSQSQPSGFRPTEHDAEVMAKVVELQKEVNKTRGSVG